MTRVAITRYLGAVVLLAVGLDHLQQYAVDHYSAVPTIGSLFVVNAVAAAVLAAGLAAPVQRLPGRAGRFAPALLTAGGLAVAAGSLAALLVSESTPLFGFMETGYRPAIVLAIALDVVTLGLLGTHLAALRRA